MNDGAMDAGHFRSRLAARILGLLGAASLAGQGAACWDGEVILTGFGGAGGSGGSGSSSPTGSTSTSDPTRTGSTTGTGASTTSSTSSTSGGLCGSFTSNLCFKPETMPCPPQSAWETVIKDLTAAGCVDYDPCQIDSGPMVDAVGRCCYDVHAMLCGTGGRPYLVAGEALVAPRLRGGDARGWVASAPPDLDGLTSAERASLAAAWTADGLLEHGSVASFARFALALLAAGAPVELVRGAHRAALDEVAHARLCFGLASAYEGEVVVPGAFPVGGVAGHVQVDASLAALAVSTLEEGCIGETVAAVLAAEQLAHATDPAVRAALTKIAADESRHAELAWSTVAWAVKTGGCEVRTAVEQALVGLLGRVARNSDSEGAPVSLGETSQPHPAQPVSLGETSQPHPAQPAPDARRAVMEAHGRLDPATVATVVAAAMAEVVAPAARTLLRPERFRRADVSLTA